MIPANICLVTRFYLPFCHNFNLLEPRNTICIGNLILLHLGKLMKSQTLLRGCKTPLFTLTECVKPKHTFRILSRKPRVVFRPTNVIVLLAYVFQLPDELKFKHLILQTVFALCRLSRVCVFLCMGRTGSPEHKCELSVEAGASLHSA